MDTSIVYPRGVPGITIQGDVDVGKQRVVRVLTGFGAGAQYGVHNNSVRNLTRGIAERVLYVSEGGELRPCRKPKADAFKRLSPIRTRLLKVLSPTTVVPKHEYASLYTGRKQQTYARAYESLLLKEVHRRDAYCSTFVKAEKINFSAKGDPAPRVIQPRSPRYNLEVGRYLKLFERELAHGFRRAFHYNVILKGLNADAVANALHDNWACFQEPVAIGLDASRFDQHVSVDALRYEHSVYNNVFRSPELARLLKWQLSNRGFGRVGETCVRYEVDGCRMSGDINTGMGNCLIMSSLVLNYFREKGINARLANNGDDCVVFCERRDLHKFDSISDYFTDFGFKLTQEEPVEVFEHIVFCQAQPVCVGGQWRMVRDPWTAMSKDCVSLLPMESVQNFDTWRDAIGTCGYELTRGVPVWESFYRAICTESNRRKGGLERIYDSGMGYMARGVRHAVIDTQSRVSFWRAFGIDPDMQVAMEKAWPGIKYDADAPLKNLAEITSLSVNPLKWLTRTRN